MQNYSKTIGIFIKNHAIVLIMWGLFAIIGILLFSDSSKATPIISEKIDPYVLSTKGNTQIFRNKARTIIQENNTGSILVGDKIRTLDSTATVFWPDGSITRLGEKSSITINEMQARTANENIRIDFSLESGKSWSNVVKYMFGESHFHERFNNDTSLAAVRGTVFEINLDRKYIHTIDHAVSIEDIQGHTGSTFVVAGGVFDTTTRKALAKEKIDEAWNTLNHNEDVIYLNKRMESLKKAILENTGQKNYMEVFLESIGLREADTSLKGLLDNTESGWKQFENEMKTGTNSGKLMDIYQEFYGLQNNGNLLDTKIKLRDLIIETSPEDKKKTLLDDFARSTLYDSWDAATTGSGNIEGLQKKLEEYIQQGADKNIINDLQSATKMQEGVSTLINTLGEKNYMKEAAEQAKKALQSESLKNANDKATEIRENIIDAAKDFLPH